ncbi:MAG TPA: insulinase family protein [Polyangiaceae bacterium]|nr:insulinase family protein [Polyangiaceae bacterium]
MKPVRCGGLMASLARTALLIASGCAPGVLAPRSAPSQAPTGAPVADVAAPPAREVDPPAETEGDVTVASVRGMPIIVERVAGAEFCAIELVIRGGVRNWSADRAGIEDVALAAAAGGGTRSLSKEKLARKLASLGATLATRTRADFSAVIGVAPTASFDDSFGIVADIVLAPAMPETEIALARSRALSDRRHELEDGDGLLGMLERRAVFANHPYAARPEGTIETLSALTPDAISAHLAKLRETSRMLLVVVGDLDAAHVIGRARAAFAQTPRGLYVDTPIPPLEFGASQVMGDAHPLATNYIGSFFAAPAWRDADHVAVRLAIDVLSHRVWEEVRSKRNLSYAPWAVFRWWYASPYAGFYVSTLDPNTTMTVMMAEARRIQTDLVAQDELAGQKAVLRTRCEQSRESSVDEASLLADGQLYAGDWRFARRYCDAIGRVSAEQIRAAARKYMTAWRTVIVGDPSKLDPKTVHATSAQPEGPQ